MGAIKNHSKLFYKKTSFPAKKLFLSKSFKLIIPNFLLLIFFANLLFVTACKDELTQPTPKPPGYQEDIPWPSLADSPWPMYRADPQNTGRSKYSGPTVGEIFRQINAVNMECVPVMGNENNLFFLTSLPGSLYVYKNYDSLYWSADAGQDTHITPVIDHKNNIYVADNFSIKKYSQEGNLLWSMPINYEGLSASLTIDKNGNIYYIGDDYEIKCIDENGNLKWSYTESRLMRNTYHSPAFSPDGNTIYLQGETVSLIAFDINLQQIKWEFGNKALQAAPVVDSDGNIYVIPSSSGLNKLTLYSLSSKGDVKWQYSYYSKFSFNTEEPAIDKYGNIYFGFEDTLYSINYYGELNWKAFIGVNISTSSKILDSNGNIYFTSWSSPNINKIVKYNSNGNFLWEIPIQNQYVLYPPILGGDGKLVVASFRSDFLYIIR